jgi:dTDP-4-dehydrorhamnose reductase
MQIIITGAEGRLGGQLCRILGESHTLTELTYNDLDITDFERTREAVSTSNPDIVINCAAWTDVDGCAENPEKALQINGYGAQNVALAAAACDAPIVHISSNEVFDGTADRAYNEYDPRNPVNPYGYSKYVAEKAVAEVNPRHYIVRTSWLFAHGGRNFIHAILGAVEAGKTPRVVVDEVANPTYNRDVAQAIAQLITTGRYGTYHLCNEGAVSRYGFARYALDRAGYADIDMERISLAQWPRPSRPPRYSGLANQAARMLGIRLRPWQQAVDAFLEADNLLKTNSPAS